MVCPGALELGCSDAARPGSWSRCRALLAGALAGPLACLGLLGLVDVSGQVVSPVVVGLTGRCCGSVAPL